MPEAFPPGIYETVLTERLSERLASTDLVAEFAEVSPVSEPGVYARHVACVVERHLRSLPEGARREAANAILSHVVDENGEAIVRTDMLVSLQLRNAPAPIRPSTPLSEVALLTNGRDEPNMASEISRELASADRVDLLCAFIRFAGIAVIRRELQALQSRGIRLRVITTTYRGATERRAVDELATKYGADVRVCYETATTRLHAKAWLFRRNSGFDTGYVGSSNLSKSAMVDGLEWNVRISGVSTPTLIRKFEGVFDTYWNDPAFKPYNPAADAEMLDRALSEASGGTSGRETITVSGLDVQPWPYQERVLEALEVAREVRDQHRNLVVAATGLGKTVIAALDYKRLCEQTDRPLSLLFVAHRKEILEQSMRKYREVLGDGSFGELYVDGRRPVDRQHVFASIRSLSGLSDHVDVTAFDVVVVDEFHHAASGTYTALLQRIAPSELLGLTATPERTDTLDILHWFGGRPTYELRLWDALEQNLLCPFHYYGIADNTDLRDVTWSRDDYRISDLENVYTGNDARTRLVLNAVRDYVADPQSMRALGFCVSIAHAEYMASAFSKQGIPAVAVSAGTSSAARAQAFFDLRTGAVACLFAVDLFNEGLDLPDVDTLLMLRPTQSATVFLQHLGRGLRRSRRKAVLTVLDFIGHHRTEFNFAPRLTALTGTRGNRLVNEVAEGFPFLPGASRIVLDRQAQEIVLDSIKRALPTNRRSALVEMIKDANTNNLSEFLAQSNSELSVVYSGSGTPQGQTKQLWPSGSGHSPTSTTSSALASIVS